MAQLAKYTWETGANGAAITQKGAGLNLVQGSWTYSNNRDPSGGNLSAHLVASGASAGINGLSVWSAQPDVYARIDISFAALPDVTFTLGQVRSAAVPKAELRVTATGAIQLRRGSDFVAIATSPDGLVAANTNLRINWSYNNTTAKQQVQVFKGTNFAGTTPDYDSGLVTTSASGTIDGWYLGAITAATFDAYLGDIAFDDAVFPAGPTPTDNPPTATATASPSTGAEPRSLITLTGTDTDESVTARRWTCDDSTVVITNATSADATAAAPIPLNAKTITFTYTVTDSAGQTGSATATVGVLPAPAAVMGATGWQPATFELVQ